MNKYFITSAKTALVLVYLVIVAGALVRLTGSGMGCPDWPKCFGYYIPPTDIKELTWTANKSYEKGQVIIKNEKLLVAEADVTTTSTFNEKDWRLYTKHDYAIFNAVETWIEYINRLVGALAGLAVLVMAILAVRYRKTNKNILFQSWFTVFLMGFQGWLGARVVYSVLNPVKITIHMVVALVIVAVLLYIIRLAKSENRVVVPTKIKYVVTVTLVLTFLQIIVGTQVRQFVDEQVKILGYEQMHLVLQNPTFVFYFHRSFSIIVLLLNGYLFWMQQKNKLQLFKINWIVGMLFVEILSGIAMYYFDFPYTSQPIHLVIASVLFGLQWYVYLETTNKINALKNKI